MSQDGAHRKIMLVNRAIYWARVGCAYLYDSADKWNSLEVARTAYLSIKKTMMP